MVGLATTRLADLLAAALHRFWELQLLAEARRQGWTAERLRVELLVALPLASAEEIARLVEALTSTEGARRDADPRLA